MNLYRDWEMFKVPMIPDGKSGNYEVSAFEVSKADADFSNLRVIFQPREAGRQVTVGTYKKLTRNGSLIMSDTRAEILDSFKLVERHRKGRLLMHGLGLGITARACLLSPEVQSVTVVEISPDVIRLIAPTLFMESMRIANELGVNGIERLTILQEDALTYKPKRGSRYDFAWHDIWDDICRDNLPEMKRLHQKFRHRVKAQASWGREGAQDYP